MLKPPPSTTDSPATNPHHDRNYATALHHAHLIQAQKDAEALILASTELLLDLPSLPTASPSHPSPSDADLVKRSLRPFQPADYDALIHERNIDRKCGYVLCPRPHCVQPTSAKYRLLYGKGKGVNALRVVETADLEKWCSDDCGRRALYIKVQLSEEPAWLRRAGGGGSIVLLDERTDDNMELSGDRVRLDIDHTERDIAERLEALAIERGDGNRTGKSGRSVYVGVKENVTAGRKTPVAPMSVTNDEMATDEIEGYKPGRKVQHGMSEQNDDGNEDRGDIMDTI